MVHFVLNQNMDAEDIAVGLDDQMEWEQFEAFGRELVKAIASHHGEVPASFFANGAADAQREFVEALLAANGQRFVDEMAGDSPGPDKTGQDEH